MQALWITIITATGVVLAAVGAALVTARSVAKTQERADQRERELRAADRQAEEQRRREDRDADESRRKEVRDHLELVHRRELAERWREERRAAHARMLTALEAGWNGCFMYAIAVERLPKEQAAPVHADRSQPMSWQP